MPIRAHTDGRAGHRRSHAELVEEPDEIGPAVERAFASGEPAVVNVLLDPNAMQGHAYRAM